MASSIEILSDSEDTFGWPTIHIDGHCRRDQGNEQRWLIHESGVHPTNMSIGFTGVQNGSWIIVSEGGSARYKAKLIEPIHAKAGSGMFFERLIVDVYDEAEWFHQRSDHPKNVARRAAQA